MHKCRSKYTLLEYQKILEKRDHSFNIILSEADNPAKVVCFSPATRSFFHPDFRENYLKPRIAKIKKQLSQGGYKFLTLTYWTKNNTAFSTIKNHKKHIKKFFRIVRKKLGAIEYAYFIELTDKFYVHFHIYLSRWLDIVELTKIWKSITGSWIIEIEDINTPEAVHYVAHYSEVLRKFSNDKLSIVWSNISRLFGQSRRFFTTKEKKEKKFKYYGILYNTIFSSSEVCQIISQDNQGFFLWQDYFELLQDLSLGDFKLSIKDNIYYFYRSS